MAVYKYNEDNIIGDLNEENIKNSLINNMTGGALFRRTYLTPFSYPVYKLNYVVPRFTKYIIRRTETFKDKHTENLRQLHNIYNDFARVYINPPGPLTHEKIYDALKNLQVKYNNKGYTIINVYLYNQQIYVKINKSSSSVENIDINISIDKLNINKEEGDNIVLHISSVSMDDDDSSLGQTVVDNAKKANVILENVRKSLNNMYKYEIGGASVRIFNNNTDYKITGGSHPYYEITSKSNSNEKFVVHYMSTIFDFDRREVSEDRRRIIRIIRRPSLFF